MEICAIQGNHRRGLVVLSLLVAQILQRALPCGYAAPGLAAEYCLCRRHDREHSRWVAGGLLYTPGALGPDGQKICHVGVRSVCDAGGVGSLCSSTLAGDRPVMPGDGS